jgi:nitroimidazol reductase NimA-like FMN-containing flavoprotein (pyridoxamine 5'-phosphate oxidase superfamily)
VAVLQQLTYAECLRRLDTAGVGRVAVTEHALPAIVPVNFVCTGEHILFRTEPGGMLAHGCDGTVVAFEIDGIDPSGTAGWSVLVVGTAELVPDGSTGSPTDLEIVSAIRGDRGQLVAISLSQVSGREVKADGKAA